MTYQPNPESHAKELADATRPCKSDPDVVGACFVVHGRLTGPYNGNPTFRIWRIGTHRMLGVYDSFVPWGLFDLPEPTSLEVNAFGDYTVCPMTKERPGVMQMVCIEAAKHVVYGNRK